MTTLEGRPAPPDIAQALRHALVEAAMVAWIEGRTEEARDLLKRAQAPAARGATPVYGLPWPILPDAPNVPADIQALAEATEAGLSTATQAQLNARYMVGRVPGTNIGAGGPVSITGPTVSFPVGKFTTSPMVQLSIQNFGGVVVPQITATTPTVFQSIIRCVESAAASSITVMWEAWSMDLSPHLAASGPDQQEYEFTFTATCATPGCHNEGEPIGIPLPALDGGPPDVVCGACGNPVPAVVAI